MKWEYKTLDLGFNPDSKINKFGADEWELVSVDNGIAYFKRPISENRDGLKLDFPYKGTYE